MSENLPDSIRVQKPDEEPTWDQLDMFGPPPVPTKAAALSADRKRTLRNQATLAEGRHPLTGEKLLDDPAKTCGNCDHHFSHTRSKTYHKCDLRATRGSGTDVRVTWPACARWQPEADQ